MLFLYRSLARLCACEQVQVKRRLEPEEHRKEEKAIHKAQLSHERFKAIFRCRAGELRAQHDTVIGGWRARKGWVCCCRAWQGADSVVGLGQIFGLTD